MDFWLDFLPIIIYLLLIIVLIIGIILGVKTIITLDKVEKIIDDISEKLQTLNGFFHIIDYTTDKIALATDKMVDGVVSFVSKLLFNKSKNKTKKGDEDE